MNTLWVSHSKKNILNRTGSRLGRIHPQFLFTYDLIDLMLNILSFTQ